MKKVIQNTARPGVREIASLREAAEG